MYRLSNVMSLRHHAAEGDVREDYVQPTVQQYAVPTTPIYMGYGSYLGYNYDTVIVPGHFDKTREVFIQTSLFDASNGKAVLNRLFTA